MGQLAEQQLSLHSRHAEHAAATSSELLQVEERAARLAERVEAMVSEATHKADFDDVVEVIREMRVDVAGKADNATMHEVSLST